MVGSSMATHIAQGTIIALGILSKLGKVDESFTTLLCTHSKIKFNQRIVRMDWGNWEGSTFLDCRAKVDRGRGWGVAPCFVRAPNQSKKGNLQVMLSFVLRRVKSR